jgi:glycosyltransferase involved in cell wall biosynthesis
LRTAAPLVTIGIPNYNYSHYIKEALNSVAIQSYPNIELVIVDDCSTDNSIFVIENWIKNYCGNITVKFIKNEINLGLTKTCNVILKHAKGKYLQTLDADDIILPEKIEKQVNILEKSNDLALIYSNSSIIDEKGNLTNEDYCSRINYDKENMPEGHIKKDLLVFNFISLPSVLVRTEYVRQAGGFDERLRVQDYYMWLKLSEKYQVKYMNENTAYYRVHHSSMSNNSLTSAASTDSVLQIKFNYYKGCTPSLRKLIKRNIQYGAVELYHQNYPTSKKWLSIAFKLNPRLKTFIYFVATQVGIPFSFFKRIKSSSVCKMAFKYL